MIIDCHCHIASEKVLPSKFFDGWSETISAGLGYASKSDQEHRVRHLLRALNEDPQCTKLLEEMDLAGIDLAVLLVIDFGIVYKNLSLSIEELHLEHKKIIDRSDRFIAFSSVDPRRGREGLELFERAVTDWGFRGLKVYSPCGFSPSDRRMFPFYEICSQRRLPVLTHVGPSSSSLSFKRSNPLGVDDAALNFPKVNFILGHAGVTLYREAGLMAQYRPNIYLDLSGFQGELGQGQFKKILKEHLSKKLVRKLLFGTDWPIHRFWGGQAKWVNEIKSCESEGILSQNDLQNILANNASRILSVGSDPI
jgi:predicted TIM-barrel fold metal-dependent hydrolase